MAVVRQVVNPMEAKHIVGITNYVDVGVQVSIPTVAETGAEELSAQMTPNTEAKTAAAQAPDSISTPGTLNIAAAWQVNKNWMVKARVGTESAAAAVCFKTWGQLGLVAAANVTCRFQELGLPRFGLILSCENFGALRYERGTAELGGRSVVQSHVATALDIAVAEGAGRSVKVDANMSDYNSSPTDVTANYM